MPEATQIYRIPASAYVRAEASRHLSRWWWALAIPVAGCAIAGIYDLRFLYLALMLSLVVYPMLLSLCWMALATKPWMQWVLRPQTYTNDASGNVCVAFLAHGADDSAIAADIKGRLVVDADTMAMAGLHKAYVCVPLGKDAPYNIPFLLIPKETCII